MTKSWLIFGCAAAVALLGCTEAPVTGGPHDAAAQVVPGDEALTSTELVQLEVYLGQLGFLAEPADGLIGPSTRAAIGAWQQAHSQPPTGAYSHALLATLENDAAARIASTGVRPAATRPAPAPSVEPSTPAAVVPTSEPRKGTLVQSTTSSTTARAAGSGGGAGGGRGGGGGGGW